MKQVTFNEELCKSCELCINVCPKQIIQISKDRMNARGYRPAEVREQSECIGCAFCTVVCPDCAITITEEE